MYIGKHRGTQEEGEEKRIHIPENYAGTAFAQEPIDACAPEELLPCKREEAKENRTYSKADRDFSIDALLILLAFLLLGSEDGGEIAIILLLLLFF